MDSAVSNRCSLATRTPPLRLSGSVPSISAVAHRRHGHLPIVAADTALGSLSGACAGGGGGGGRGGCGCTASCCSHPPAGQPGQGPATSCNESSLIQSTSILWACHSRIGSGDERERKRERDREDLFLETRQKKKKETEQNSRKQEIFDVSHALAGGSVS